MINILVEATLCTYTARNKYADIGLSSDQLEVMQAMPLPVWYTDRVSNPIDSIVTEIGGCANQTSVIIVYGIPNKDCNGQESSSGSNSNMNDYVEFINNLKSAVDGSSVIYILEPDAVALSINQQCGSQLNYVSYVTKAYEILSDTDSAQIYIDIGFWTIIYGESDRSQVMNIVNQINTNNKLKGISLNLANYRSTSEMQQYCSIFKSESSNGYNCIIDTSRNANGPSSDNEWCNYNGAGIGLIPEQDPNADIDYYLWLKPPGDLDGQCVGRANSYSTTQLGAGDFDINYFNILWNNRDQTIQSSITSNTADDTSTSNTADDTSAINSTASGSRGMVSDAGSSSSADDDTSVINTANGTSTSNTANGTSTSNTVDGTSAINSSASGSRGVVSDAGSSNSADDDTAVINSGDDEYDIIRISVSKNNSVFIRILNSSYVK